MLNVTVYLKSGQTISFGCVTCSFIYNEATCEFTGYEITGLYGYKKVSFDPNQIAAYTIKE